MVSATKEARRPRAPQTRVPADQTPQAAPAGWRRWAPWLLVVLATVIGLVSALNVWVKRQALSTDNWTAASSQLLENTEIRNALSVYIVDQLYENVDVGNALEERLPPATRPLGPPLAAALEPALVRITNTILARPRVQQLWENANRRAHQLFMAVLDGKHGILEATNGNVVLNLRPIVEEVAAATGIGSRLTERVPPDAGRLVIMKGNQLEAARKSVKAIRMLSYLLTFLVLALFAAAIFISRDRRRTLMAVGISFLVVGLLVLLARRLGGNYLVDALTSNPDAKRPLSATWAIGTNLLRNVGINAVIYGALTIFAAWLAGPARWATSLRGHMAPTMRERPVLVYGAVSLGLLVVLLTGPTDGQRVYPLLLLFALALVGTEVLRRQTQREFPASAPAPVARQA